MVIAVTWPRVALIVATAVAQALIGLLCGPPSLSVRRLLQRDPHRLAIAPCGLQRIAVLTVHRRMIGGRQQQLVHVGGLPAAVRVPAATVTRDVFVTFLTKELGTDNIDRAKTYMEDALRMTVHLMMSTPEYQIV